MNDQPTALRLAEAIWPWHEGMTNNLSLAAAELRRLHAKVERLTLNGIHTCHAECQRPVCKLTRERDALLEALKVVIDDLMYQNHARVIDVARAAIKTVEGEKK